MTLFFQPHSLDQALAVLTEHPALTLAAGATVLMASGEGRSADGVLDLLTVPELRGIRAGSDELLIGATTTFSELRGSQPVRTILPLLASAADQMGGWQIRNRATLGGNVAGASPAADAPPVLLALDAVAVVAGPGGWREVRCEELATGPFQTVLQPGEIVVRFRLPRPPRAAVQRFRKVGTRRGLATGKLTVAMVGRLRERRITELRLAAGNVAPTPLRLRQTEQVVLGRKPDDQTATLAGATAAGEASPVDDAWSTAAYRSFVLERVVRRMVLALDEPGC